MFALPNWFGNFSIFSLFQNFSQDSKNARASKFVLRFKICSQDSKNVCALIFFNKFQKCLCFFRKNLGSKFVRLHNKSLHL